MIDGQNCLIEESLAAILLSENGDQETKMAIREAICNTSSSSSPDAPTSTSSGVPTLPREYEIPPQALSPASSESASGRSTPSGAFTCSSHSQNTMHVWKESEEKLFIDLRLQREDKFTGTKSHDVLWGEIASEMKKNGIQVSKTQLINKWKALKKNIRK